METHHVIPISLYGENIDINTFKIGKRDHKELHETQNVPYSLLRKYRERTNQILIPNEYTLDLKGELWNSYFSRVTTYKEEQLHSLILQGKKLDRTAEPVSFEKAIEVIIEAQKNKVRKIMENYELSMRIKEHFRNYLIND